MAIDEVSPSELVSEQSDSEQPATNPFGGGTVADNRLADNYSITDEPLYYGTALGFAFLGTLLTAPLGQSWLLPALQALMLTIFMFPLIRQGKVRRAIVLLGTWLVVQFLLILILSMMAPGRMELTIADGFNRRTGMLAWFYADDLPPSGLIEGLGTRLVEILAIVGGSLVTGGLIGFWLLIRGVNLAAFYAGTILAALSDTANGIGAFPIWSILRLSGYTLLALISAGPLLAQSPSLGKYFQRRRTLLIWAVGLTVLGLLFELILPDLWRSWFS